MPKKSINTAAADAADELSKNPITQEPQTDPELAEMPDGEPSIHPEGDEKDLFSQTGTDTVEFMAEGTGLQGLSSDDAADSQTGAEDSDCPPGDGDGTLQGENASDPQTDSENDPESDLNAYNNPDASQTEPNTAGDEPGKDISQAPNQDTPADSQTDSGNSDSAAGSPDPGIKSPRKRSVKSQSGETNDDPDKSDAVQEKSPKPTRRRTRVAPVLSIDEQRTVETREDREKNDLLDMVESLKGKKNLAGTIQGVERSADNPNLSFAVIYHGAYKVIIPAEETILPPTDFRDRSPADVMHYLVTKRLGAEVDFIVKGVTPNPVSPPPADWRQWH